MKLGHVLAAVCLLDDDVSAKKAERRTNALCEKKAMSAFARIDDRDILVRILSYTYRPAKAEVKADEILALWPDSEEYVAAKMPDPPAPEPTDHETEDADGDASSEVIGGPRRPGRPRKISLGVGD